MAQRRGFVNIQIQAKQDLFELYEDSFNQSGANSKAEFQRMLLDCYLEPEVSKAPDSGKIEESLRVLEESLRIANEEKDNLFARLALYETEEMKAVLKKHKGEKLVFNNYNGKSLTIEINDLPDVFFAIFNSVKIK